MPSQKILCPKPSLSLTSIAIAYWLGRYNRTIYSFLGLYLTNIWLTCMLKFKMNSQQLNFIHNNQKKLRAQNYIQLKDAVSRNDANTTEVGQMVILPASFTGGPRYMHERTQDAMTYVCHYGRPDLFITITCKPEWSKITENLLPGQKLCAPFEGEEVSSPHLLSYYYFHLNIPPKFRFITFIYNFNTSSSRQSVVKIAYSYHI